MQEFLLELESGEFNGVPTTQERFDGIETRLTAIDEQLGISSKVHKKDSFWPTTLVGWCTVVGITITVLGVGGYVGSLIVDRHIQSALTPIRSDIRRIDGDVQFIKGTLSVIQAQIAARNYSTVPPKDLKNHREELKEIKAKLVQAQPNTPGYWPAAFEVIRLLSKTNFDIEPSGKRELYLKNLSGISPRTISVPPGTRVLLQGLIQNSIFQDMIVRFDQSVRLQNVTFINCIFIFPMEQNPPKPLQQIGITLLASDLSKVTITAS